jgi:16S rRNA (uracil1498-N3)-methyltransferase
VIQKTTELGINRIIPVVTERSQVRSTGKTARWRKIAEDASRQCGRANVPLINDPLVLKDLFSLNHQSVLPEEVSSLIFWEDGGIRLQDSLDNIGRTNRPFAVAVGPEGGFREDEVRMAEAHGFTAVSLGSRILRAETAAITAVAIMQFSLGDLG